MPFERPVPPPDPIDRPAKHPRRGPRRLPAAKDRAVLAGAAVVLLGLSAGASVASVQFAQEYGRYPAEAPAVSFDEAVVMARAAAASPAAPVAWVRLTDARVDCDRIAGQIDKSKNENWKTYAPISGAQGTPPGLLEVKGQDLPCSALRGALAEPVELALAEPRFVLERRVGDRRGARLLADRPGWQASAIQGRSSTRWAMLASPAVALLFGLLGAYMARRAWRGTTSP